MTFVRVYADGGNQQLNARIFNEIIVSCRNWQADFVQVAMRGWKFLIASMINNNLTHKTRNLVRIFFSRSLLVQMFISKHGKIRLREITFHQCIPHAKNTN
jgi:hypothetical protein